MASDDVTPALYAEITDRIETGIRNSQKIQRILSKAEKGDASHIDTGAYSLELGKITSRAMLDTLTETSLPNSTLYYHIAKGTVSTTLKDNLKRVNAVGTEIQTTLNRNAGIGLNAVNAPLNKNRINTMVDLMCKEETLEDARKWLEEPVINLTQSYSDSLIKANADFQYKSGMAPQIKRSASVGCCEWCAGLEGTYDYPVDTRVYQRHESCRCTVDFYPHKGDGKVQDVWTKEFLSPEEAEKREERKNYGKDLTWTTASGKKKRV